MGRRQKSHDLRDARCTRCLAKPPQLLRCKRGSAPPKEGFSCLLHRVCWTVLQGMKKRKHVRQSRYTGIVIALGSRRQTAAPQLVSPAHCRLIDPVRLVLNFQSSPTIECSVHLHPSPSSWATPWLSGHFWSSSNLRDSQLPLSWCNVSSPAPLNLSWRRASEVGPPHIKRDSTDNISQTPRTIPCVLETDQTKRQPSCETPSVHIERTAHTRSTTNPANPPNLLSSTPRLQSYHCIRISVCRPGPSIWQAGRQDGR
jgi:hypothetical protein